jgi:SAM-dependent methyltransferase
MSTPDAANLDLCLSGKRLYGDDFEIDDIRTWYQDEQEAYASLISASSKRYEYGYHALNQLHGFRHLPPGRFTHALGFGSAFGDEVLPIAARLDRLTVVDNADVFGRDVVHGIPARYVKPDVSGRLPFASAIFDLITCLGVLHHIPNVSDVLTELHRCLMPSGFALVREPVISMGNWMRPRPGLTKHERGIPDELFAQIIAQAGFHVVSKSYCMFPLIPRLWSAFGGVAFNSTIASRLDSLLARSLRWNLRYHATRPIQKFRPTVVFYVLGKS